MPVPSWRRSPRHAPQKEQTLRLKEIQYRVDAVRGTESRRVFEAAIEVEDSKVDPRVSLQAMPFGH